MILSKDVVNHFGSLITIAFMAGSDGKENASGFPDIEREYCDIVMQIKKGEPYIESLFSQRMIDLYMSAFEAEISAYQLTNTPLPTVVEILAKQVCDNANSAERYYCKQTFDSFVKKMSDAFDRPALPYLLSKASDILR